MCAKRHDRGKFAPGLTQGSAQCQTLSTPFVTVYAHGLGSVRARPCPSCTGFGCPIDHITPSRFLLHAIARDFLLFLGVLRDLPKDVVRDLLPASTYGIYIQYATCNNCQAMRSDGSHSEHEAGSQGTRTLGAAKRCPRAYDSWCHRKSTRLHSPAPRQSSTQIYATVEALCAPERRPLRA